MIRNYENPEGTIALIDSTSVTVPVKVFTSSTTGGAIAGGVTGRTNAVTTIAFCNTTAPSTADETTNQVILNIYIVRSGKSFVDGNLIVSNLTVPAGETVFFSEERIVLDSGDEIWVGTSAASRLSVTVSALAV
jgi:hypothetical protein